MAQSVAVRRMGAILVGASLGLAGFWLVAGPSGAPAQAQIPDSGAQLQQIIVELQQLNKQVAELREIARVMRDEKAASAKQPGAKPAR